MQDYYKSKICLNQFLEVYLLYSVISVHDDLTELFKDYLQLHSTMSQAILVWIPYKIGMTSALLKGFQGNLDHDSFAFLLKSATLF